MNDEIRRNVAVEERETSQQRVDATVVDGLVAWQTEEATKAPRDKQWEHSGRGDIGDKHGSVAISWPPE